MLVEVFGPDETIPKGVIFPEQTHRCNIEEVITGTENLADCDGIWTKKRGKNGAGSNELMLGIKTADCAPIAFWDTEKYGIIHAGWRGLVGGIVEGMLEVFEDPEILVGPILPQFEVQRDFCYEAIMERFGDTFFTEDEQLIFDFQAALQSIIPQAKFDPRVTAKDPLLASWRRDKNAQRNVMVIS